MTGTTAVIAAKKLKIKISSQILEPLSGTRSCVLGQQLPPLDKCGHSFQISKVSGSNKRGPLCEVEGQRVKRQKMDRAMTQQCSTLVKDLLKHKFGWAFSQPVDPVKMNVPDYFSIISRPMDLGTIKSKLQKNLYVDIEEIAADIRLTFSNAMLYNPSTNDFHVMAKYLNNYFESRWKSLEEKWNGGRSKFGSGKLLGGQTKDIGDVREHCPKTPPLRTIALPKKSKIPEGKAMTNSLDTRATEVKPPKSVENCVRKSLEQHSHKGIGRHTGCFVNAKSKLSPVGCKSSTCSRSISGSTLASSDISSDRSAGRDNRACSTDTSKLVCQAINTSILQMSKSDPDSDGAVSALDDGNTCHSSQHMSPATDATSGEGWRPSFDLQLSPTKALRAAMLKQRFADTIFKARQKTLPDNGDKADPVKMQQEKERLERRQREEKARIEVQLRAAEAASQRKGEIELKRHRERAREAARIALEKMEKTIQIEQDLEILKELEMLCGCSLSYGLHFYGKRSEAPKVGRPHLGSPLEQFGLFLKDDIEDEDDDAFNIDGEEGEILF